MKRIHTDKKLNIITINKTDLPFGYRNSGLEDYLFIWQGEFLLQKSNREKIREKIDLYLKQRRKKQPYEYPSAGSVFKNPEGRFAGELIDKCGLKGMQVGGAVISQKHANFILNTAATSDDIYQLIKIARDKVREKFGVELELEIKLVGEFS